MELQCPSLHRIHMHSMTNTRHGNHQRITLTNHNKIFSIKQKKINSLQHQTLHVMESQYLRIHIIHKPFMNLSYGTANQSTTYKLLSTDNKRLERLPLYFHVRGEVLAQWLFTGFSIHLHIGVFPLSTSDFQSNS